MEYGQLWDILKGTICLYKFDPKVTGSLVHLTEIPQKKNTTANILI